MEARDKNFYQRKVLEMKSLWNRQTFYMNTSFQVNDTSYPILIIRREEQKRWDIHMLNKDEAKSFYA